MWWAVVGSKKLSWWEGVAAMAVGCLAGCDAQQRQRQPAVVEPREARRALPALPPRHAFHSSRPASRRARPADVLLFALKTTDTQARPTPRPR